MRALRTIPVMEEFARDMAVSYTHLDVYKRQEHEKKCFGRQFFYVSNESKSVLAQDLDDCCDNE